VGQPTDEELDAGLLTEETWNNLTCKLQKAGIILLTSVGTTGRIQSPRICQTISVSYNPPQTTETHNASPVRINLFPPFRKIMAKKYQPKNEKYYGK
jgi:hypothetical protein